MTDATDYREMFFDEFIVRLAEETSVENAMMVARMMIADRLKRVLETVISEQESNEREPLV